jgi:hypothetical protein
MPATSSAIHHPSNSLTFTKVSCSPDLDLQGAKVPYTLGSRKWRQYGTAKWEAEQENVYPSIMVLLHAIGLICPRRTKQGCHVGRCASPDVMSRRMGYTRPALKPCISPRGMSNCSRAASFLASGLLWTVCKQLAPGAVF